MERSRRISMMGLQREIVETEQKLKSLEEQAKQSGTALQEIAAKGEKLKTVGDNVTNMRSALPWMI